MALDGLDLLLERLPWGMDIRLKLLVPETFVGVLRRSPQQPI
jgi:hypothetical protein